MLCATMRPAPVYVAIGFILLCESQLYRVFRTKNLFQFCRDYEILRVGIIGNVQHIGLAADLAVFNIHLMETGGSIECSHIPVPACGALEARVHTLFSIAIAVGCRIPRSIASAIG